MNNIINKFKDLFEQSVNEIINPSCCYDTFPNHWVICKDSDIEQARQKAITLSEQYAIDKLVEFISEKSLICCHASQFINYKLERIYKKIFELIKRNELFKDVIEYVNSNNCFLYESILKHKSNFLFLDELFDDIKIYCIVSLFENEFSYDEKLYVEDRFLAWKNGMNVLCDVVDKLFVYSS